MKRVAWALLAGLFCFVSGVGMADIPRLEENANFELTAQDIYQWDMHVSVYNTPVIRIYAWQGTNAYTSCTNYNWTFKFAKSDSSDSMTSISGVPNGAGYIDFTASTNTFNYAFKRWYSVVYATTNGQQISYARGYLTCHRSPEVNAPGPLVRRTSILGSAYEFTGSFTNWPFPLNNVGTNEGDIFYYRTNNPQWVALTPAPASSGYYLQSGGTGVPPSWATPSGAGDITAVNVSGGVLTGGGTNGAVTITLTTNGLSNALSSATFVTQGDYISGTNAVTAYAVSYTDNATNTLHTEYTNTIHRFANDDVTIGSYPGAPLALASTAESRFMFADSNTTDNLDVILRHAGTATASLDFFHVNSNTVWSFTRQVSGASDILSLYHADSQSNFTENARWSMNGTAPIFGGAPASTLVFTNGQYYGSAIGLTNFPVFDNIWAKNVTSSGHVTVVSNLYLNGNLEGDGQTGVTGIDDLTANDIDASNTLQVAGIDAVLETRKVTAGTGISGGGFLSNDVTIAFDSSWGDARYASALSNNLYELSVANRTLTNGELVVNGGFTNAFDGWVQTNVTYNALQSNVTVLSGNTGYLVPSNALSIATGRVYEVSYIYTPNNSYETITVTLGGDSDTHDYSATASTTLATNSFVIRADSLANFNMSILAASNSVTIDNISVREITNGPLWAVDGYIQNLYTESVDGSGVDRFARTNDTRDLDWTGSGSVLVPITPDYTNSAASKEYVDNRLSRYGTYYFWGSTTSQVDGFYVMQPTQRVTLVADEQVYSTPTNGQFLSRFLSEPGSPGVTEVQAGNYTVHLHAKKSSIKEAYLSVRGVLRDANGALKYAYPVTPSNSLTQVNQPYDFVISLATNLPCLTTDRWAIESRVAAIGAPAPDITIYTENGNEGFLFGGLLEGAEVDPIWVAVSNQYLLTNKLTDVSATSNDTQTLTSKAIHDLNGVQNAQITVVSNASLQNVVEDTTPELGGNLDAQDNNITDVTLLGVGTNQSVGAFTVMKDMAAIGPGAGAYGDGEGDLYVKDELEVDGVFYADGGIVGGSAGETNAITSGGFVDISSLLGGGGTNWAESPAQQDVNVDGNTVSNAVRVYLNLVDYIYTDGTNLLWSDN